MIWKYFYVLNILEHTFLIWFKVVDSTLFFVYDVEGSRVYKDSDRIFFTDLRIDIFSLL